VRDVISTYLEVPPSRAIPTLCATLVKAVLTGSLTAEDVYPLNNRQDKTAEAFAVGRLFRVVYFAYHGLAGERRAATPVSGDPRP
jgi:hypothetical protein